MEIGIWTDGLATISFEPFAKARVFYRIAIPDGWNIVVDNRWPPEWPKVQWSGVVLRGPSGETVIGADALGMAFHQRGGFSVVSEWVDPAHVVGFSVLPRNSNGHG